LETFRLPGESQQIDRITETFADAFMESKPAEVANAEAAYVLAFSVIMLNTDQHNRQVRVSEQEVLTSIQMSIHHHFTSTC
jgi:brefeldin A-resistance guanine nucleotide exchange factor 1